MSRITNAHIMDALVGLGARITALEEKSLAQVQVTQVAAAPVTEVKAEKVERVNPHAHTDAQRKAAEILVREYPVKAARPSAVATHQRIDGCDFIIVQTLVDAAGNGTGRDIKPLLPTGVTAKRMGRHVKRATVWFVEGATKAQLDALVKKVK